MENIQLNNGINMPIVGSGSNTFGKEGNSFSGELRKDTQEVDWAIENGYHHFDSAQIYGNETVIGKGLKKSDLPRDDFFITTKLNTMNGFGGEEWARNAIETSLDHLETDYVDLFLIHFPWDNDDEILEAWKILEDYYNRGVFKAIGVSNFKQKHLDIILNKGDVKPAANQIESHIGKWNDELIAYNKEQDIATIAWGPLSEANGESRQVLEEIAEQYGKTYTQVVLRYQIERGVSVIPKSHDKNHQAQSIDLFDFQLSETDRKRIASL